MNKYLLGLLSLICLAHVSIKARPRPGDIANMTLIQLYTYPDMRWRPQERAVVAAGKFEALIKNGLHQEALNQIKACLFSDELGDAQKMQVLSFLKRELRDRNNQLIDQLLHQDVEFLLLYEQFLEDRDGALMQPLVMPMLIEQD